ncbi:cobalt-zinc-cadmium resistance protein CzcC domain protein [Bordetella bronchiseptica F4563]|uniref:TolC family protein n=1 Tax=Bordetella bronchiseptica TaxID=518 RepID=UPI00046118BE|nr:TolC family protein [Bordetella bronchiseptica]KDC32808.1 cobalt-zinc-cadmium resistance protein CzcC domain protein [Bordetella bronchiseptica F4563]
MRINTLLFSMAALMLYFPPSWSSAASSSSAPPVTMVNPEASLVLTLEHAIEIGLARSPVLSAARNQAEAKRGLLDQAGLLPNPSIDLSVDDHQRATRTTTTMINIPVEIGGKRAARKRAASLDRDISTRDIDTVRAEVRAQVVARFFEVAIAQETVRVSKDMARIAQEAYEMARKRVESGKAAPLERSRAEIEMANARIETRSAETSLANSITALAILLGDVTPSFSGVGVRIDDMPTRPSLDDLKAELSQSPRINAARLAVDLGKAEVDVERTKRYPDITVGVGMARDNEMGRNRAQFGISIPLPLFDRNQGNIYAATMQSYRAQDLLRDIEMRMTSELLQAVSRYDLAAASAREYRDAVLPRAEEAYQVARKGFEAGKMNYLEVLDAQRALSQANIAYLTVLSDSFQSRSEIDRVLGR